MAPVAIFDADSFAILDSDSEPILVASGSSIAAFTDQDLLTQIQYAMIEDINGGATFSSGLWTPMEVINYLNQRQNRFLKDSQIHIGLSLQSTTEGINIYDLPDDWITTVRVIWISPDGATRELLRSNSWEADNAIPTWTYVEGPVKIYMDVDTAVLTIKLAPLPNEDGMLQIHYVPLAALLTGAGELITLPAEFASAIKYGAMADMFSKVGRAMDERAAYCAQRFELGVEIANMLLKGFRM